jgi:uncharacterized membrane protein YeaQ/YmgE (transglycosylase-associated protein family)
MEMNNTGAVNPALAGAQRVKGISGSTLKLIAIFTMLIDHTAATILEKILMANGLSALYQADAQAMMQFYADNGVLYGIYTVMRLIGRIAFPIFCFLLVEGFLHTRNATKYAVRLALFAAISEIPFDLALFNKAWDFNHQNVFFTLLIGLLTLICFRLLKEKADGSENKSWLTALAVLGALAVGGYVALSMHSILTAITYQFSARGMETSFSTTGIAIVIAIVGAIIALIIYAVMCKKRSLQVANLRFADLLLLMIGMTVADLLKTDYSAFGVLTVAVVYGLRKSYFRSMLGACITLTIMTMSEFTCFVNLIFIRFYNGTRGLNLKYIFYVFYPAHLFILYLICRAMNLT